MKPAYKKSWAGNLMMWTDLTLGPSSRSNDDTLALMSCLSSGYKFASALRCLGLVAFILLESTPRVQTSAKLAEYAEYDLDFPACNEFFLWSDHMQKKTLKNLLIIFGVISTINPIH